MWAQLPRCPVCLQGPCFIYPELKQKTVCFQVARASLILLPYNMRQKFKISQKGNIKKNKDTPKIRAPGVA